MKYFLLALTLIQFNGYANELRIFTEISSSGGTVLVYLQNISDKPQRVLTKGLSILTSGDYGKEPVVIILSPPSHSHTVKVNNNGLLRIKSRTILKESLGDLGLVELKPKEMTYIQHHGITYPIKAATLKYQIREEWAAMHNVWGGRIETTFDYTK